jgi:predicted MFS family arabinose efflux permease
MAMIPSASSDDSFPEIQGNATLRNWLAVLSVSLGAFVVVTSEFLPIGLLTNISSGLKVSDGIAGLMVTIPGLVAAIAAPVMTIVAGRVDRRVLVLALMALLAGSNLIAALSPNFAVMLIARVLFGVTLGGFWTIAVTLGGRLVPKSSMARATTIIMAGISIATVAGVPVGTLIAGFSTWRAAFGVIGLVALLAAFVQLFVLPKLPAPAAPGLRQITGLLHHPDARLGLLTVAVVMAGHFAAYTYVTPFLKDHTKISPGFLSSLLLAFGVAGIFGNFLGGAFAAKNLRATITSAVILLGASVMLLPFFAGNLTGISTLLLIWGLAFGALPIVLNLWVFKAAPDAIEGGAALLVSTFQIFIALGSVLGGQVVDAFGTSAVMWGGGATAAIGLVIIALTRSHTRPAELETIGEVCTDSSCCGK